MSKIARTLFSSVLALAAAITMVGCGAIKWPPAAPVDFYERVETRMPLERLVL